MKVWITKYALTQGIFCTEVKPCFDINPKMVSTLDKYAQCYHGGDWHENKSDAVARAEEMRKKKIFSMEKQIKKIQALKF